MVKNHVEASIGSRDFDDKLVTHFSNEFKRKTKLDIAESAKAVTKLRLAAELTKRTLSQSTTSPISVESLHEGEDLRSTIDRKMYDVLIGSIAAKILGAIEKTLADAQLTKESIQQVCTIFLFFLPENIVFKITIPGHPHRWLSQHHQDHNHDLQLL